MDVHLARHFNAQTERTKIENEWDIVTKSWQARIEKHQTSARNGHASPSCADYERKSDNRG